MAQHPWRYPENHPAGLESAFNWRGVLINSRNLTARYHVDSVEGFHSLPRVRAVEFPYVARDGVAVEDLLYGGRTVILSGRVIAGNVARLRVMEQNLHHLMMFDQVTAPLVIQNGNGSNLLYGNYFFQCRPMECSFGDIVRSDSVSATFRLVFQGADPRILSATVRERDIVFTANTTVADPIWNFPNYGNWYAKANVQFRESSNATLWSLTQPRVMLAQKIGNAIGHHYAGSATAASGSFREIFNGFMNTSGSDAVGYVRITDGTNDWGNQNLVNQGVAYSLVIPPVNFNPDIAGHSGSITTHCTARTNNVIARVRWADTWL